MLFDCTDPLRIPFASHFVGFRVITIYFGAHPYDTVSCPALAHVGPAHQRAFAF